MSDFKSAKAAIKVFTKGFDDGFKYELVKL
jgi:hypothetical protein